MILKMAATNVTVTVDANTKLVLRKSKGKTATWAEYYFNWETGNVFEFPATASPSEVAELYKA